METAAFWSVNLIELEYAPSLNCLRFNNVPTLDAQSFNLEATYRKRPILKFDIQLDASVNYQLVVNLKKRTE